MFSVSTQHTFDGLQRQNAKKQAELASAVYKISTGYKAENWGEAPKETKLILSSFSEKEQGTSFKTLNERSLHTDLKPYEMAISQANQTLKDFFVLCKTTNNASIDSTISFPERLRQLEELFITLLNQKDLYGNYIFSGIRTDKKPVDMTDYPEDYSLEPTMEDPTNPGTWIDNPDFIKNRRYFDYYKGSNETLDIKLKEGLPRTDFRITANHDCFEKALRAFRGARLVDLGPPQKAEHLAPVEDILVEAIKQLNDELLIHIGYTEQIFLDVNEGLMGEIDAAKNTWGDTAGQDILEGLQTYQLLKVAITINNQLTFNTIKFLEDFVKSIR
jgi:flagellin-like hook-associated protein FlgL